jgi:hypothetical protein
MKPILLLSTTCLFLFFASCKKDGNEVDATGIRLMSIESPGNNGGVNKFNYTYDNSGRIVLAQTQVNNEPPVTSFSVSYTGNIAILALPVLSGPIVAVDTTRLFFDNNKRVTQRIKYSFLEVPAGQPQRSYVFDTTRYEYDAAGYLLTEKRTYKDTTWFNPVPVQTSVRKGTSTTNYTYSGGNMITQTSTGNNTNLEFVGGIAYPSSGSFESNRTFEYSKAYPNKLDFTNEAILREAGFFSDFPVTSTNKNLPDKTTYTYTGTGTTGNMTLYPNSTISLLATFNQYGLLSTLGNPAMPGARITFVYSK